MHKKSIAFISFSDFEGGASIAARRIFESLKFYQTEYDYFFFASKLNDINSSKLKFPTNMINNNFFDKLLILISLILNFLIQDNHKLFRSFNLKSTRRDKFINKKFINPIINLHWIGRNTLSIKEVSNLKGTIVWTMHDSWALNGAEHLTTSPNFERFKNGYIKSNKKVLGVDLDRYIWNKKLRLWSKDIYFICPTRWMQDNVNQSYLFNESRTIVIPNPIPTDKFRILDNSKLRLKYQIPDNFKVILYGSYGISDPNKGFDLLSESLIQLLEGDPSICLITIGPKLRNSFVHKYFDRIFQFGQISSLEKLAEIYNLCDVLALPSRVENLSQLGAEASACGLPIVAFDVGGNRDLVEDGTTGFLVEPFNLAQFKSKIHILLNDSFIRNQMKKQSAERAKRLWNYQTIAKQYFDLFKSLNIS